VDIIDAKLEAARKFGASHTINANKDNLVEATKSITDGGVEKAFEAIGNTKTADLAIRATRPGGTAVIIGGLGRGPFTISDGRFAMNEIRVTGVSSRRANDINEVLRMIAQKRIDVAGLVSKKYRFDEINEALNDLENGRILMGVSLWN
jgi:S-(hydroxymethyl)glutathione dehydrogenase/alcohol dehydrogenase